MWPLPWGKAVPYLCQEDSSVSDSFPENHSRCEPSLKGKLCLICVNGKLSLICVNLSVPLTYDVADWYSCFEYGNENRVSLYSRVYSFKRKTQKDSNRLTLPVLSLELISVKADRSNFASGRRLKSLDTSLLLIWVLRLKLWRDCIDSNEYERF